MIGVALRRNLPMMSVCAQGFSGVPRFTRDQRRNERWYPRIVATWRGGNEATLRRNVMLELAGASVLLLLAVLLAGNAPAR